MRILVLLPRFPYPLDKGDKLRAYHQIVELNKRHEVYIFALSHTKVRHGDYDQMHTVCTAVDYVRLRWWESVWGILKAFFKGEPLQLGYWSSRRARRAYADWERQVQPDVVYCQMVRTVISATDRDAISPNVVLVPNGVDTSYFNNQAIKQPNSQIFSVVFVGNMSYAPNVDAACWLVKEIMPLVRKQCPYNVRVLIAGADPKPAVKALAGPKVTVSGRLEDIRTAYASAKMFVAPMRIGSGMQNKLLEAMSMSLPCVTTTLAAAPLGDTAWKHLLVGDTAEQIADLIVKLGIEELHDSIADGGNRFVKENYSWPAAVEPLEKILYEQLESKQAR